MIWRIRILHLWGLRTIYISGVYDLHLGGLQFTSRGTTIYIPAYYGFTTRWTTILLLVVTARYAE